MLTPEALLWRRGGIGASEAKIIANGDGAAWAKLRHEKLTGERDPVSKQTQLFFDLGHAIESVCVAHFHANVAPLQATQVQVESALDPFFRCTLDGLLADGTVLEAKSHFMDRSMDELIESYWPQLQHQMFVTQTNSARIAVIFGHYAKFDHETVDRDEAFLDVYRVRAFMFKHYLETGVLPPGLEVPIPANIVRGRDHVWPEGHNQVAPLAATWLASKDLVDGVARAEKDLKALVPDDCKTASWYGSNGLGITIKVDKAGKKSLRLAIARTDQKAA